jgi:hypothetical protein
MIGLFAREAHSQRQMGGTAMLYRYFLSATALIAANLGDAAAQNVKPPLEVKPTPPSVYRSSAPDLAPPAPFRLMGFFSGDGNASRPSSNGLIDRGSGSNASLKTIETVAPTFFDPRTGEPAIWYYRTKSGEIELFDRKGFHPSTGEKLTPITRDVVSLWKAQLARLTPKPINNPKQFGFFDPLTGSAKVWFRRTETGKYEFFDGPGYYPGSGEPLSIISRDVINTWQESLKKSFQKACYVITRDAEEPVRYGNEPGFNAISGRQCRELTPEIAMRVREYEKGNRPKRIDAVEPAFFDSHTGEPIVWYFRDKTGNLDIFDLMGFHPETGEELLPISKDIVNLWQSQRNGRNTPAARTAPQRIDPDKYSFFDPVTGESRVWYWRSESGDYAFYDSPGFQPRTGDPLQLISKDVIAKWKREVDPVEVKKKEQLQRERERAEPQEREQVAAPEAQEQDKQVASRCDQLAGNPNDPHGSGAGVPYDVLRMQARDAVEACTVASAANPGEHRFKYQLGRALEFLDRKKAFDIHADLVKHKYPAAYDNLGWMLFYDRKDVSQAVNHFRMGAELGDPDSMISLADMIHRGAFNPPNSIYVKMSLLKKAAGLGDQAALRAYSERQQDLQNRQINEQERQRRMLETVGDVVRSMPWH